MTNTYSNDLRTKIIYAIEEGSQSKPQIARLFNVSVTFIYTLWNRYKETGSVDPKKRGGYCKPKVDKEGEDHLREWIANYPDMTLDALSEKYSQHFLISIGKSSIDRALKRMAISYKKKSIRSHKI